MTSIFDFTSFRFGSFSSFKIFQLFVLSFPSLKFYEFCLAPVNVEAEKCSNLHPFTVTFLKMVLRYHNVPNCHSITFSNNTKLKFI